MSFPNRGEGGGPPPGKNSHIFQFFFADVPELERRFKRLKVSVVLSWTGGTFVAKKKNLCGWGTRVFASRKDNQSRSSHSSLITINESRYLMWQKAIKGVKFIAVPQCPSNDGISTLSQLGSSGQHIRCSQDASFPGNKRINIIQRKRSFSHLLNLLNLNR